MLNKQIVVVMQGFGGVKDWKTQQHIVSNGHQQDCEKKGNTDSKKYSMYQWFFNLGSIEPQGFVESASGVQQK